jgi:hypothetical protein
MITEEMKKNGIHCRGQGFNCYNCKDKNKCLEYEYNEKMESLVDKNKKHEIDDFFKRKGIIKISNSLINSNPISLLETLKDILVIKAENNFIKDEITYYGYSKYFDIVKDGEGIPEYIIIVTKEYTDEYESMNVRIEKVF